MTKTLNQIIFFPPPKSEYFFQQHWESEYFFRKKPYPPPTPLEVKWSVPKYAWCLNFRLIIWCRAKPKATRLVFVASPLRKYN